jgi:hypothetical protein
VFISARAKNERIYLQAFTNPFSQKVASLADKIAPPFFLKGSFYLCGMVGGGICRLFV